MDSQKDDSQALQINHGSIPDQNIRQQKHSASLHILDYAPAPGWSTHVLNDGRLYYCNHITRTAGWLPPAESWKTKEPLPYGWERAVDESGKTYYINHLNKTTTYESPSYKTSHPLPKPKPRIVTLERSSSLGFGFVAGSEKPVIVRFVTEGGPSVNKLLPGDHILSVNGEDVKTAPREHVISLVRSCAESVTLVVCQPDELQGVRKSTLLSTTKRARLKSRPSRVRFAESVCVNGAPLFPLSSVGDLAVPPIANVLKVFLENGQTKSFKYNAWTKVQDVVDSLQSKLCLQSIEHFSMVVEHIKSIKRNKLTLLDPNDLITKIAAQPGSHKLRCLFRVAFVPSSAAELAQKDLNTFDYLYNQCCNDVIQEKFSPELQCDTAFRLAALHICQHALANNIQTNKFNVKIIEKQFGLERFVPASLFETFKIKEIRRILGHFIKLYSNMAGPNKQLSPLQIKLHYLDIVSQLPSYGAKCFPIGSKGDSVENVILVSPKFGISQITGHRNSVFHPVPIANIDDMDKIEVKIKDEISRIVYVILKNDKIFKISLEEKDALELVLVLRGYFKLATGEELLVSQEKLSNMEDEAPPYLASHRVVPEKWSYMDQNSIKTVSFGTYLVYQSVSKKTNGLYNTVGRQSKQGLINYNNFESYSSTSQHYKVNTDESLQRNDDKILNRSTDIMLEDILEQQNNGLPNYYTLQSLSEWQESSVDVESDSDEPGKLKHSDSLTLLTNIHKDKDSSVSDATMDILRQESLLSESDTDSLYTPRDSPHSRNIRNDLNVFNDISFGLRSPNTPINKLEDFQKYLEIYNSERTEDSPFESMDNMFVFDTDIIDLTLIPPPPTPDELDSALPSPINIPPILFADSEDHTLDFNDSQANLEDFLASVTISPPMQKVTSETELTPQEILAYIIPPPPSRTNLDNSDTNAETEYSIRDTEKKNETILSLLNTVDQLSLEDNEKSNTNEAEMINLDHENNTCVKDDDFKPLVPPPRRSIDQKPPARPPRDFLKNRQCSPNMEESKPNPDTDLPAPELPPRMSSKLKSP